MAITLGDLFVRIRGDQSGLDGDLQKAEGKVNNSAGRMGGFFTGALQHAVGGAILGGINAIGGAITGAISTGIDFNRSMENATAQINAFTKDGAKTAEIIEMIRTRAAATPFEFNAMTTAAAALIPTSKQAGVGLEDLIKQAEILAASNPSQGLEGAAFALKEAVSGDFTSIIERFNLPRKFINDLKKQGVPELEIVSRAMAELGLDASLVGNMANTADGKWSTLKDTLSTLAGTITKPVFDVIKNSLGEFTAFLSSPAIQSAAASFANTLSAGIGQTIAFLTPIVKGVISVIGQFGAIVDDVAGDISDGFSEGGALGAVFNGIGRIAEMFGMTGQSATALAGTVTGALEGISNIVHMAIGTVISFVQANLPAIQSTITTAFGMVISFVQQNWPFVEQIIGSVIANVKAFIDNPLTPALAFVIGLFGQVVEWIKANWPLISETVGTVLNAINNVVQTILPAIRNIFAVTFSVIAPLVQSALTLVLGIIKTVLQLINGDISGALQTLQETFASIFGGIITGIETKLAEMGRMLAAAWVDMQGKAEIAWNQFSGSITSAVQSAIDWVGGLGETLAGLGRGIIDGIIAGINAAPQKILEALSGIVNGAIAAIKKSLGIASPSKVTMKIGNQIMDGFMLPIEMRAGEMMNALGGMVQQMTGAPALPRLVAAGAPAAVNQRGDIHIHMGGVTMANDMDAYTQAYRIAKRVRDGI